MNLENVKTYGELFNALAGADLINVEVNIYNPHENRCFRLALLKKDGSCFCFVVFVVNDSSSPYMRYDYAGEDTLVYFSEASYLKAKKHRMLNNCQVEIDKIDKRLNELSIPERFADLKGNGSLYELNKKSGEWGISKVDYYIDDGDQRLYINSFNYVRNSAKLSQYYFFALEADAKKRLSLILEEQIKSIQNRIDVLNK